MSAGAKLGDSIAVTAEGEKAEEVIAAVGAILVSIELHSEKEQ